MTHVTEYYLPGIYLNVDRRQFSEGYHVLSPPVTVTSCFGLLRKPYQLQH